MHATTLRCFRSGSRGFQLWLRVLAIAVLALTCRAASAEDWKDALKAEKAQNAARIAAIELEAAPVWKQLKEVRAQISRHNGNRCVAPSNDPGACTAYNQEAEQLNSAQENLVSRLQPLNEESDRLIARNQEIERRLKLACVPLPTLCRSNSDCNECSSCGSFNSTTGQGVCQPVR